jgi:hypothetical protein
MTTANPIVVTRAPSKAAQNEAPKRREPAHAGSMHCAAMVG